MSFAPPPQAAALGPVNPLEAMINSVNTNGYLIGLSMLLLNLGGRHLAGSLTPEQDRFFQNPWVKRILLFFVIFMATRNVFTAIWLTLGVILIIGYLFNEHSSLYVLGMPIPEPKLQGAPVGLTGEETEIYKRLQDKAARAKDQEELKRKAEKPPPPPSEIAFQTYSENMKRVQGYYA